MDLKDLLKISKLKKIKFKKWEYEAWHRESNIYHHFGGGIYRMYDESGEIIYVGKSKDLHRRLLQHIGKDTNTAYFIDEVKKIDFFVVDNSVFQTLLEGIFIAWHMPKYNDEVKHYLKEGGAENEIK